VFYYTEVGGIVKCFLILDRFGQLIVDRAGGECNIWNIMFLPCQPINHIHPTKCLCICHNHSFINKINRR
jgi:hypothetical protein